MLQESLSTSALMQWIGQWWWPFVRFSAVFWIAPIFNDYAVNTRLRIILAFLLALLVMHLVPNLPVFDPLHLDTWICTGSQILFGLFFGLMLQMLFLVLTMAGNIISQQMGLSMAMITDPVNGQSEPIIGELLYVLCGLLFFSLNGHLVMLDVMAESLRQWPPGQSIFALNIGSVIQMLSWVIASALVLTLPAIGAMLMVNLTFGIIQRTAPAFNIFALGFPMSLMTGLIAFWLSLSAVPAKYLDISWHVLTLMRDLSGGS